MNIRVETEKINGKKYYSVRKFAQLTNKSEKAIYGLIKKGNAIRKLKADYVLGHPMIPAEELTEFVFTGPGRYPLKDLYKYTEEGLVISIETLTDNNDAT